MGNPRDMELGSDGTDHPHASGKVRQRQVANQIESNHKEKNGASFPLALASAAAAVRSRGGGGGGVVGLGGSSPHSS